MPIVDVEVVCPCEVEFAKIAIRPLADALGQVFGSAPGRTWVRLRHLGAMAYAENESIVRDAELPAFVTVLHARLPGDEALAAEAAALTLAVARCLARAPDRVHVQYAPPGAGRQAFGGQLIH